MRLGLAFSFALIAGSLALQGCGGASGDPGARALPVGESCGSIRSQLDRLDAKGTQPLVEKASNGGKLTPAQRADVDAYNNLLNHYLGARCHV